MSSCPSCGEPTLPAASFCEACGAELPAEPTGPPCVVCAGEVEGDYCLTCGHKQPSPRDHMEVVDGRVAGVTDRGRRHHRNEDAMALADLGAALVLVVCDGVSSTDNPDQASQAAADAFLDTVAGSITAQSYDAERTLVGATTAAQEAVLRIDRPGAAGNPSCTLAAAVVRPHASGATLDVAWVGDSRIYWLDDTAAHLLTTDHSWAQDAAAAGLMAIDEAMADPRAHTITRWLGADAIEPRPDVHTVEVGAGRLVACSDGLWNYAADPAAMAARAEAQYDDALAAAVGLTAFANESGGHDNITVVVADIAAMDTGAGT